MIPNAPEAKNPVTASPMVRAAGTITGLKMTKSGAVTASPRTDPVRASPARKRRKAPTGNRVTRAIT